MKAILEFPAPESCWVCWFSQFYENNFFCTMPVGRRYGYKFIPDPDKRAPFCPLKIVEEEKEDVSRN